METGTYYIDGKRCTGEIGANLIESAKQQGILIPSLCYYKHINPPLATCRTCIVEVDGYKKPACLVKIKDGIHVTIYSDELNELRKSVIEMMFAEGNHVCPSCEKSGDCDLQHMAYQNGIRKSRFPHLFVNRVIDFHPKRMVIDHNRCVKCMRCVEEVINKDGKKVFSFIDKGNKVSVGVDYTEEEKLSDEEALQAMHLCPTGAILVKGKSETRPFGDRKYDFEEVGIEPVIAQSKHDPGAINKKIVATASLAGCFGCHMSMLDADEKILDVFELVEFNKSPLTDIKTFTKKCDVGLIEGGCCNVENVEALIKLREKCEILISVGECSVWGGIPALRNTIPLEECLNEAYLFSITSENTNNIIPAHEDIPKILDRVYACHEIVKIDHFIPGCPPAPEHIWGVVKSILRGQDYSVLYEDFKYD
jgi:[NiFe] hydrogenase diaphorase moiety small subunit